MHTRPKLETNLIDQFNSVKDDVKTDTDIYSMFEVASQSNKMLPNAEDRRDLFDMLVEKVVNVRMSAEFNAYNEKFVVRGSTKTNTTGLDTRKGLASHGVKKGKN